MRKAGTLALVLVIAAGLLGFFAPLGALTPQNQPGPGNGGTDGVCTYCSTDYCGCSAPPSGYSWVGTCECSPIQCSRSCVYQKQQ
jgi:hypothetical protein